MRIVGGSLKGRPLAGPKSDATRPTTDRTREAIFNLIAHGAAARDVEGARVLDLFAGTGALGLEALSRGAATCLFVETAAGARGTIRQNIETLGVTGRAKIFRREAHRLGELRTGAPYDLLFADPPYGQGLGELALACALAGGWLAPGALCVVEERAASPVTLPAGFAELDRRRYGDTEILLAEVAG